jgi:hypothetical protein
MKWKHEFPFHASNPALDSENETMIEVSDRIALRFDPIRSWSDAAGESLLSE